MSKNNITMLSKDAVAASLAECYITIGSNRYNFMSIIDLEAKMNKSKTKVPVLGRTGKGNKAAGWDGEASGKAHYNTSIVREMLLQYKDTGEDVYFETQISNDDPSSEAGRQTIVLIDCNLDGGILAKFDADGEYLEEDINFTFDDWKMPEKFKLLTGMAM